MHKGMGMYTALWVLSFMLTSGCLNDKDTPIKPQESIKPEKPEESIKKDPLIEKIGPSKEISVSGKIMLGPVVKGHNLQLVIYDTDMKELYKPRVGLDGSYGFKLKDYTGVVIAQVTSANPDQCSDDYIDEATAKPKCLGKSTILSSRFVESGTTNNEAKLHTTPVTTVAVIHAGVNLNDDGSIALPKGLTQGDITQSNTAIAKVFGLGDKSIAEYTPKSIITTDQKFQAGDAYTNALAAISGVEASNSKDLNSVIKQISEGISTDNNTPNLAPVIQDMMVRGVQKVAEKILKISSDKSVLANLSKYQDKFPKSILAVDLTKTLPEPPKSTKVTKRFTRNNKPTWDWTPKDSETVNYHYQYRIGENDRSWKQINTTSFTPSEDYTEGLHTLIIRQADLKNPDLWSKPTKLTIEINKPPKIITGSSELKSATEDKLYSTQLKFKDPDSQKLYVTINKTDKNDWLSFSNNEKSIHLEDPINGYFYVDLKGTAKDHHISKGKEQENIEIKITVNDNEELQSISKDLSIKLINFDDNGKIKLNGTPNEKETLRAIVDDEDGLSEISYRWKINSKDIPGETNDTITLTQKHTEKKISVLATYIDGRSNIKASVLSHEKKVININDKPRLFKNKASINKTLITYEDDELSNHAFKFVDVDPEDTLTYTFKNLPDWIDQDAYRKAGILKGIPINDDVGKRENIKITARDKDGEEDDITFSIEVKNINDEPSLQTKGFDRGDALAINDTILITLEASDPDLSLDDMLYFRILEHPSNGNLDIKEDAKINLNKKTNLYTVKQTYTYTRTRSGEDSFSYIAIDKGGLKSSTGMISIKYKNLPPVITDSVLVNAKEGKVYSEEIKIKDIDSNELIVELGADAPEWLNFSNDTKKITIKKLENDIFEIPLKGLPLQSAIKKGQSETSYSFLISVKDSEEGEPIRRNYKLTVENINQQGEVKITGKFEQNHKLTAELEDKDGFHSPKYKWYIDKKPLNEKSNKLLLTQDFVTKIDETKNIRVEVNYIDEHSGEADAHSEVDKSISNINDEATGKPIIERTDNAENDIHEGFELKVNLLDIKDLDDIQKNSFNYQWMVNGEKIQDANGSKYTPKQTQVGKKIQVIVEFKDQHGGNEKRISNESEKILNHNDEPSLQTKGFDRGDALAINDTILITLEASDPDLSLDDMLYFRILEHPSNGNLDIKEDAKINLNKKTNLYTVKQTYTYTRTRSGEDSFSYIAIDKGGLKSSTGMISIKYKNLPPVITDSVLDVITGKKNKGIQLNISDDLTTDENLFYSITEPPKYGDLFINGDLIDDYSRLFNKTDELTYKNDRLPPSGEDFFKFSGNDGIHNSFNQAEVKLKFTATQFIKIQTPKFIPYAQGGKFTFKFLIEDNKERPFTVKENDYLSSDNKAKKPIWLVKDTKTGWIDSEKKYKYKWIYNTSFTDNFASVRVTIPIENGSGEPQKRSFIIKPTYLYDHQNEIKRFTNTTWIDVCWEKSQQIKESSLSREYIIDTKSKIKEIIKKSWEKYAPIMFEWRDGDVLDINAQEIYFNCSENIFADYGQLKVIFKHKNENIDEISKSEETIISLDIKENGTLDYADENTLKREVIHKFGHALGFPDENKRLDNFSKIDNESCKNMNENPIIASNQSIINQNALKQISFKEFQKQPYDPFSIMNECISADDFFDHSADKISDDIKYFNLLSKADIEKVRKYYGNPLPSNGKPHFMLENEPFTGLFKGLDDTYASIKNGVLLHTKTIDMADILKIKDGGYFTSKRDAVNANTLRLYKANHKDAINYKLANDILTVCDKPDDDGMVIVIKRDCVSIESFAKEKGYTEVSVYYELTNSGEILEKYCDSTKALPQNNDNQSKQDMSICLSESQMDNFYKSFPSNNVFFYRGIERKPTVNVSN